MRAPLLATLLLVAATAHAGSGRYPIDVESELNGLDIKVTATPGALAVLTLQNKSKSRADCTAEFEGGLQTPGKRSTRVAAGKNATLSYKVKDDLARLRVKLVCKPTPPAKPKADK
jgi:hypothetical protein